VAKGGFTPKRAPKFFWAPNFPREKLMEYKKVQRPPDLTPNSRQNLIPRDLTEEEN